MTILDLSHPIAHGTITYPGLPAPALGAHLTRADSRDHYAAGVEFQIDVLTMVGNTGTYLDTPFHRYADGGDLAALDLARVAAVPGSLIDLREDPDPALDADQVAGRAVLLRSGWDEHWGTPRYGDTDHPSVGPRTLASLIEHGAAVVGIDSVNIDATDTGDRPVHSGLLGAGIPIVEHLRGLDRLTGRTFTFTAAPPAVVGMGTFPVRAFATT